MLGLEQKEWYVYARRIIINPKTNRRIESNRLDRLSLPRHTTMGTVMRVWDDAHKKQGWVSMGCRNYSKPEDNFEVFES